MAKHPEGWRWELLPQQITSLEAAVRQFLESRTPIEEISPLSFAVPTLRENLEHLCQELINGKGFSLVSGLDLGKYSREEIAVIFMGLGSYIGNARSQNAAGHLLGHVRNLNMNADDPNVRIYQTANRQTFHTDSADVVGLICLKQAQEGGESLLVSGETIYNEMNALRPDLAVLLFEPIATDKRGEVEPGTLPYFSIPVFSWFAEKLTVIYQRQYIDSAQRFEEAPRLSAKQVEALDLFDKLANDERLNFKMTLQPGQMQFVHNHNLLHDREAFVDWPNLKDRRHLLRLWLSVSQARELPAVFAQRFGTTEVGNRGGVICEGTLLNVPLR